MALFSPIRLRQLLLRNRIAVSPMCMYSSPDGAPNDWHFVHLGSRAVGGAGLVIVEATAVTPDGRISPLDLGIWNDAQASQYERITRFIREQGAAAGIQLAHAGRKASTSPPWLGGKPVPPEQGGWSPVRAPSALPFSKESPTTVALTEAEIGDLTQAFVDAARRAHRAGFQVVELHMAHGYLLHEFLSPLTNKRADRYGGSFENRVRFPLEVARAVRAAWPADLPLLVRISTTDWHEGGWDLDQSIEFAKRLKEVGVDVVDCSSGGLLGSVFIPAKPHYQVPFAQAIREKAGVATAAVGLITDPRAANDIVAKGEADLVLLARELLRDPYWPLRAATELKVDGPWPNQYLRAKPAL